MDGVIASLFIYPVKGCSAVRLDHAEIEARGLRHDRGWMLVGPTGRFVSQRGLPALALLRAEVEAGSLRLTLPDGAAIAVPDRPGGERCTVTIWGDIVAAEAPSPDADALLSRCYGKELRLVRFPDEARRPCDPTYAPEGSHTGFPDGFPILVTSEASLAELNEALAERDQPPVPMSRFRPNIVLSGLPTRAEDQAGRIRLGDGTELLLVKPCDRCVVTTVDQASGRRDGSEPLTTLGRIRRNPKTGGVHFGVNAVPGFEGGARPVRVGAACSLLP